MAALDQARQSLGQVAALRAEVDSWRTQNAVLKELNGSLETDNGLLFDAFNEELDAMYDDVHQEDGSAMQRMVKDLQASKKSKMALAKELAYVVVSSVAWSELTRDLQGDEEAACARDVAAGCVGGCEVAFAPGGQRSGVRNKEAQECLGTEKQAAV